MAVREHHLQGTIGSQIAWAESCYRDFGEIFRGDLKIEQLITGLEQSIRASHHAMEEAGVRDICGTCEKEEGGSCCGKGMEVKYDGPLLLINLLLGHHIPKTRQNPRSCLFLGTEGCLLPARHVICINYLCKKITDRIRPESLSLLREKEGKEIEYLFLVKERVLNVLRIHGDRTSRTDSPTENR